MSSGRPVRILIMEDDAGQARLAQRTLERAGYAVEVAGDGDTGLALYATGVYDVLMVDHQMPGKGGLEVLRTDRKSTRLNSSHSQISYAVFCLIQKNI